MEKCKPYGDVTTVIFIRKNDRVAGTIENTSVIVSGFVFRLIFFLKNNFVCYRFILLTKNLPRKLSMVWTKQSFRHHPQKI